MLLKHNEFCSLDIYNLFKYFISLVIFSVLDLLISKKSLSKFMVIVILSIYPYILYLFLFIYLEASF